MLTAKYIDTGEEIDITKFDNPRLNIDKNQLRCKLCNGKISLKHGMLRAKHFFHISSYNSNFERHPESPQHNLGKEIITQHLKRILVIIR
ncbi:competence protein CoiA family protein [Chryseobacterium sp. JUb7]|uniref:competence protein CoiA family protein n=1 Tax=Chryseobacterium sp. JUb7 TaxID=2940599 RepID=UPI002168AD07|nr:competence protein CoiA family protein [Chryseobacterium sp. JUb7]MCS3533075.1 competence CoiA-like predicted nuclease [Chryseobacterium sp. JUb7]